MVQTSIDWLIEEFRDTILKEYGELRFLEIIEQAKEMHKNECISFAEQWEIRCNEKDMDSKEQLYDEIYNK